MLAYGTINWKIKQGIVGFLDISREDKCKLNSKTDL